MAATKRKPAVRPAKAKSARKTMKTSARRSVKRR